jgi:uncharacterized protein (TIGR04562 family)
MSYTNDYESYVLDTVIGGVSSIDLENIHIDSIEEADAFVKTYGYDIEVENDVERLWSLHVRAVAFIRESLLIEDESLPSRVSDRTQLQKVSQLLLIASNKTDEDSWAACAVLRVMHVLAHIENDIFVEYSDTIQDQVLRNFREHIIQDDVQGTILGRYGDVDRIHLKKFEVKPFKATSSSLVKLLSKPQAVAFTLLDKMGIRFVTKNVVDAFRVVRFLAAEHIVSTPNIMPDQGRNNLYPLNLFLETVKEAGPITSPEEIDQLLAIKWNEAQHRAEFYQRKNEFSSSEYRSMKFICRHLIRLNVAGRELRFFFPYEIQILDYDTYIKNLGGATAHEAYKKRQLAVVRGRVLGKRYEPAP